MAQSKEPNDHPESWNTPDKSYYRIGDQLITLEKYGKHSESSYVIVNLHSDELATAELTMKFMRSHDVPLIRLLNKNKRKVEAEVMGKKLSFDPARIFTTWGRRLHLKLNKCWSRLTGDYVQQFARFVLDEIPDNKTVIVLNQNPDVGITHFKENGELEKLAKAVYQNQALDEQEYFQTTDEDIFNKLREGQQNVVLLHPRKQKDNGSLTVYCEKAGRTYVNLLTRAGNVARQEEMLEVLHSLEMPEKLD